MKKLSFLAIFAAGFLFTVNVYSQNPPQKSDAKPANQKVGTEKQAKPVNPQEAKKMKLERRKKAQEDAKNNKAPNQNKPMNNNGGNVKQARQNQNPSVENKDVKTQKPVQKKN